MSNRVCEKKLKLFGAVKHTLIATEVREVVASKVTKVESIFSFVLYWQKKDQLLYFFAHLMSLKIHFEV